MILSVVLAFASVSCQAWADPPPKTSKKKEDVFEKRMTSFFQNPTKAHFDEIAGLIAKNEDAFIKKSNHVALLMAVFLARAHEKFGFELPAEGRIAAKARQIVDNGPDDKMARFVNHKKPITPTKLDVWWVSFFATGDEKYLELILSQVMDLKETKGKHDMGRLLVAGAANWSFRSNVQQHPAICKFAEKAAKNPKWKEQRDFLESCIAEASKPKEPVNVPSNKK